VGARGSSLVTSRLPLAWLLAWRFLRGRGTHLLTGTARSALLGTGLGVFAMVVAMALMTGYSEDLQRKLVGNNAAVGVYPLRGGSAVLSPSQLAAIGRLPAVTQVGRVSYGQGLLAGAGPGRTVDVTLRGVEPGADPRATAAQLGDQDGLPGVVLGEQLAAQLGVAAGDAVRLTALGFSERRARFRFQNLRVAGTFRSGFSEFDRSWALLDRRWVEALAGGEARVELYEVALRDPVLAAEVAPRVEEIVGAEFVVSDWRRLNRELFSALALQKKALFFALGLIVLVSTFNVASTLMVLVRERMRELGALSAMGLPPRSLAAVFLAYGTLLGLVGTTTGIGLGWGVCELLSRYELIRLDADVAAIYFLASVPFRVELADIAAIAAFALALTTAACLYPVRVAARIEPGQALRYE
jgi:lipoprotein-releasing system permease protein